MVKIFLELDCVIGFVENENERFDSKLLIIKYCDWGPKKLIEYFFFFFLKFFYPIKVE